MSTTSAQGTTVTTIHKACAMERTSATQVAKKEGLFKRVGIYIETVLYLACVQQVVGEGVQIRVYGGVGR